jgi:hypothetical protein
VLERAGRLLVGRSPRVRRGNRIGLAVALLVAAPVMLGLFWFGGAPAWGMAALGAPFVAGGLWSLREALTGDFELCERRDIVFEKTGDRVMREGTVVCALSGITAVEVKTYPTRGGDGPPDELALSIGALPGGSPAAADRIVLLKGLSSDLEEPASRIAAYVGVPRRHA